MSFPAKWRTDNLMNTLLSGCGQCLTFCTCIWFKKPAWTIYLLVFIFSVSQLSSAFLWYTVSASKVRLRYIKRKWKYSVLVAATGTSGFYYSYITYSHLYQHLNKILKSPPSLPPTAPHWGVMQPIKPALRGYTSHGYTFLWHHHIMYACLFYHDIKCTYMCLF